MILGGSAGGYTVLQSLVDKPGFWRAGVCLYGISNQFTLALMNAAWKFEARYSEMLLGVLPEAEALYRDRSPLFHADRITDAVIVFQGEDDQVVPKEQADSIVAVLRRRGVPHEYHVFRGRGARLAQAGDHRALLRAGGRFLAALRDLRVKKKRANRHDAKSAKRKHDLPWRSWCLGGSKILIT